MTEAPPPDAPELAGRRVLLGLTGGIACYKAAELCRLLVKAGAQVRQDISREMLRIGLPPTAMDIDARDRAQMTALIKTLIHNISPEG